MHRWDEGTDLLAHSVVGYAIERLKTPKDTTWGARPADELAAALDGAVGPEGIGGHEALTLFRDVLMHACRPMDSPLHLAYVATAPTPAANLFDLVVERVEHLRWVLGERRRGDRRREPGVGVAGRTGRLSAHGGRLLRHRRLGGQSVGARHRPPPCPQTAGPADGTLVVRDVR